MKQQKNNFLDCVPVRNPEITWEKRDEDTITLVIRRRGLADRVVQKLFHKADASTIDLEQYGSFLWNSMDGKKSIFELADLLKNRFGEEVEPLYPRITEYFRIMQRNDLIRF